MVDAAAYEFAEVCLFYNLIPSVALICHNLLNAFCCWINCLQTSEVFYLRFVLN